MDNSLKAAYANAGRDTVQGSDSIAEDYVNDHEKQMGGQTFFEQLTGQTLIRKKSGVYHSFDFKQDSFEWNTRDDGYGSVLGRPSYKPMHISDPSHYGVHYEGDDTCVRFVMTGDGPENKMDLMHDSLVSFMEDNCDNYYLSEWEKGDKGYDGKFFYEGATYSVILSDHGFKISPEPPQTEIPEVLEHDLYKTVDPDKKGSLCDKISESATKERVDYVKGEFEEAGFDLEKLGISDVDLTRIVSSSKQSYSSYASQLYDQAKDSLGDIVLDDIPLLQSDDCQMGL